MSTDILNQEDSEAVEFLRNIMKRKDNVDRDIRIVILQRGWVVVGEFKQEGETCYIENGHVIRSWGTKKGLGEIAINGPTKETILDETPTIMYNVYTTIATILCNSKKWKDYIK